MVKGNQLYKKERLDINLARIKKAGQNFEIVIDADKAVDYKAGKSVDLKEVLAAEHIFSDAQKGMIASEALMASTFNTSDPLKVAEIILKQGEIQLTSAYREKIREDRKKKIIDIIHRNAVDPKTGLPHPPQRIEAAMKEAKVHIAEFKKAEDQVQDIIKSIRTIIPIRFEKRKLAVRIPANYAVRSYPLLKNFGIVTKDEWQSDGSLIAVIELPAGMQQDFMDEINKFTKGEAEVKIIKE